MDNIYESAFATIITASVTGSANGQIGVGCTSRVIQPSAAVQGLHLVSTLPHVSVALLATAWMVEWGWTYQEAILSRRCLIFPDQQVYFVCRLKTCCEAVVEHPGLHPFGSGLPWTLFEEWALMRPPGYPLN